MEQPGGELRNPLARQYLTRDIPRVHGVLKVVPEDFLVDEVPQYPPSGKGDLLFLRISKRGLSTFQAIRLLARTLDIPERHVGYAGLKDARAVTSQMVSVPVATRPRVETMRIPGIRVLSIDRHHQKLKIGHLKGNRFRIRVRRTRADERERFFQVLEVLKSEGVPNYFGRQRFGFRANSHILGRAILTYDYPTFLENFLGKAHRREDETCKEARGHYDQGDYPAAINAFLPRFTNEAKAITMLAKTGDPRLAYNAIPRKTRQFFVSAYQSYLFNCYLDRRVNHLNRLETGDLIIRHSRGDLFAVLDPPVWVKAMRNFEVSATGPIFGGYMRFPRGPRRVFEEELLASESLTPGSFLAIDGFIERGARRPLRFPVHELEVWFGENEAFLSFYLPKGCYATSVFDELFKEGDV